MGRNYKEEYEKFKKERSEFRAKLKQPMPNKRKVESVSPKVLDRKFVNGGKLKGKSHAKGGIPIEVEGGEFIIKKTSVNRSTLDTLDYINKHGDLPVGNAKKRRK